MVKKKKEKKMLIMAEYQEKHLLIMAEYQEKHLLIMAEYQDKHMLIMAEYQEKHLLIMAEYQEKHLLIMAEYQEKHLLIVAEYQEKHLLIMAEYQASLGYCTQCDTSNNLSFASNEDSDQPGHLSGLIRNFNVCIMMKKAKVLSYPLSAYQTLFETGWMPKLI